MKKYITIGSSLLILSIATFAQNTSGDSIKIVKQQKAALDLGKELRDNKIKLANFENSLERQNNEMIRAQDAAQTSADDNAKIADRLVRDPSNRKLARKAKKAARTAQRKASAARKEMSRLEDLKKDIATLKKKIAENEEKLNAMPLIPEPPAANQ
jgi:hypothetical protein